MRFITPLGRTNHSLRDAAEHTIRRLDGSSRGQTPPISLLRSKPLHELVSTSTACHEGKQSSRRHSPQRSPDLVRRPPQERYAVAVGHDGIQGGTKVQSACHSRLNGNHHEHHLAARKDGGRVGGGGFACLLSYDELYCAVN